MAFYGLFRIGELTAKSNRFSHQCNVELQPVVWLIVGWTPVARKVTVFVLVALVVLLIRVIQMRKSVLLAAGNLIGGSGGGGGAGGADGGD